MSQFFVVSFFSEWEAVDSLVSSAGNSPPLKCVSHIFIMISRLMVWWERSPPETDRGSLSPSQTAAGIRLAGHNVINPSPSFSIITRVSLFGLVEVRVRVMQVWRGKDSCAPLLLIQWLPLHRLEMFKAWQEIFFSNLHPKAQCVAFKGFSWHEAEYKMHMHALKVDKVPKNKCPVFPFDNHERQLLRIEQSACLRWNSHVVTLRCLQSPRTWICSGFRHQVGYQQNKD